MPRGCPSDTMNTNSHSSPRQKKKHDPPPPPPPPPPPVVHPRSTIAASTHEHPFYFCTVQRTVPIPSSSPLPSTDEGREREIDLSSRVKLVERANARHELNSISIIGRALHNREVLIPIPATTDSRHSRAAIERHGLHLHDPRRPI